MNSNLRRGAAAEARAERELQRRGLQPLTRNWRCPRGELDLVMRDADTLVFVEVRSRAGVAFGGAAESVDRRKRARLVAAARSYLAEHPQFAGWPARFDVVAFESGGAPIWLRDAFQVEDA